MKTLVLNWLDYGLLGLLLLSMGLSLLRGLLREVISLATWLVALWLAYLGMSWAAMALAPAIPNPDLALVAGFGVIFLGILLLGAMVNIALGQLLKLSGLGGVDRLLGLAFGFGRGILLWILLMLVAGLTPLPQEEVWQRSAMLQQVRPGAETVRGWLPADLAQRIQFDAVTAVAPSPAVSATPVPAVQPAPKID